MNIFSMTAFLVLQKKLCKQYHARRNKDKEMCRKVVLKMRTTISDAFEGITVTREGKERRFL